MRSTGGAAICGLIQLPRKTRDCLLDFQVLRGERIAGYVEAKRPAADLDLIAESEQLKRYRAAFPNLLLTNFRELRLYRGDLLAARVERRAPGSGARAAARAARPVLRLRAAGQRLGRRELAPRMALRTRILAARHPRAAGGGRGGDLRPLRLLPGLLGAPAGRARARRSSRTSTRRRSPTACSPPAGGRRGPSTGGSRRRAFRPPAACCATPSATSRSPIRRRRWRGSSTRSSTCSPARPVRAMLERSARQRGRDPVLEFYETFLHHYDPDLRRRRGVYYTPPELVSYVVRSVHRLLQTRLGRRGGLADPAVSLLDPAAGTLTFVVEAIRCAVERGAGTLGGGGVPALVGDHLLRDFHAFELMMAPYAIGHLKMSVILEELGRPLREGERVAVLSDQRPGDRRTWRSRRSPARRRSRASPTWRGRIKKERRITVILGNPPWSGQLGEPGQAARRPDAGGIRRRGRPARRGVRPGGRQAARGEEPQVAAGRLREVPPLRPAQDRRGGRGDRGVRDQPRLSRQSHLPRDAPVAPRDLRRDPSPRPPRQRQEEGAGAGRRGGRQRLRRRAAGGGGGDPGQAARACRSGSCRADLWGSRAAKLRWLGEHDVETTAWREIEPAGPAFLFAPRDAALEREYRRGVPLPEIFPVHSVGIVTGRDAFAIDTDPAELEAAGRPAAQRDGSGRHRPARVGAGRQGEVRPGGGAPEGPRTTPSWRDALPPHPLPPVRPADDLLRGLRRRAPAGEGDEAPADPGEPGAGRPPPAQGGAGRAGDRHDRRPQGGERVRHQLRLPALPPSRRDGCTAPAAAPTSLRPSSAVWRRAWERSPRPSWSCNTSTPSSTARPTGGGTPTSCGRTSRASRCRRTAAPSSSWRGSARC